MISTSRPRQSALTGPRRRDHRGEGREEGRPGPSDRAAPADASRRRPPGNRSLIGAAVGLGRGGADAGGILLLRLRGVLGPLGGAGRLGGELLLRLADLLPGLVEVLLPLRVLGGLAELDHAVQRERAQHGGTG